MKIPGMGLDERALAVILQTVQSKILLMIKTYAINVALILAYYCFLMIVF